MSLARPFITPTYQSNLNSAIRDVVVALNSGDTWGAWEALKTLFYLSPPKVMEKCQNKFTEIQTELKRLSKHRTLDITTQQTTRSKQMFDFLYEQNVLFFDLLKKNLFVAGYLERPSWHRLESEEQLKALEEKMSGT